MPVALMCAGVAACDRSGSDGAAQKTTGHIESAIGSVTGDQSLKRQGKKDEVVGGVKSAVGDAKDAIHDATK
jgi:uncharacterized protein YjbJ (UPF0337 family)